MNNLGAMSSVNIFCFASFDREFFFFLHRLFEPTSAVLCLEDPAASNQGWVRYFLYTPP